MSTSASSIEESQLCAICGDAADGYHYSVISCRGCNAFFRRTAPMNIQFVCNRGGNCFISKNKRCACRACRFAKCVAAGMNRAAVQPKRDSYGSYNRCRNPTHLDLSKANTHTDVFDAQIKEYENQLARRNVMVCTTLKDALVEPKDLDKTMRPVRAPDDYEVIQKVEVVQMFEWSQSLPQLKHISPTEKTKLLKCFAPKYHLLENSFYSMQRGFSDRIMLINNTFIAPGLSGIEMDSDDEAARQLKLKLFGYMVDGCISSLIAPMIRLQITLGEMVALKLITFWNTGDIGLTDSTKALAKQASDRAITDLHSWYQRKHFENIPERFGSLILLLPGLLENTVGFVEEMQVIRTFNLMENLTMLNDLLLP